MLKVEHILHLKLDIARLRAHQQMPSPVYAPKKLTGQIISIGEATLGHLLNVPPDLFQMQLEAAREHGTSYILEAPDRSKIGISAATSLIHGGEVILKHLIVPRDCMGHNPQLKTHYIIGVFLRGDVVNGEIPNVTEVEVAGWTDMHAVRKCGTTHLPTSFKTKLPVVAIPCSRLRPIDSLIRRLEAPEMCV